MGGNALKQFGIESKRITKGEYQKVWDHVKLLLQNPKYGFEYELIPSYANKPDFGDMDVLVSEWDENIQKDILKHLDSKAYYKNGSCLSAEYNGFQIDFIHAPLEHFDFSLNYYSYNDLGNLIGRVAHKMGLKFGHDGLHYVLRDGTHVLKTITLTTTFIEALSFLRYDYRKFYDGDFLELEDIFKYASSSPYFNKKIYNLDNRNAISRERDRKRKTYMEFLKWVELPEQASLPAFDWNSDKAVYLPLIFDYFPHFKVQYELALEQERKRKLVKEKFNGEFVGAWTGLQGPLLGHFISYLNSLSWWTEFVLHVPVTQVEAFVKEEIKTWKEKNNKQQFTQVLSHY